MLCLSSLWSLRNAWRKWHSINCCTKKTNFTFVLCLVLIICPLPPAPPRLFHVAFKICHMWQSAPIDLLCVLLIIYSLSSSSSCHSRVARPPWVVLFERRRSAFVCATDCKHREALQENQPPKKAQFLNSWLRVNDEPSISASHKGGNSLNQGSERSGNVSKREK